MAIITEEFKNKLEKALEEFEVRRSELDKLRTNKTIVKNYRACPIHETDYEIKFLFPLLTLLGWDVYSSEVLVEAPIKYKSKEHLKRVDLVLCEIDQVDPKRIDKNRYKIVIDYKKSEKEGKSEKDWENWENQIKKYFLNSYAKYGIIATPVLMKFYWKKGSTEKGRCPVEKFTLFFKRNHECSILNYSDVFNILSKDFVLNKLDTFFKKNYYKIIWKEREKRLGELISNYNCKNKTELFANIKYRLDVMREALDRFSKDNFN